MYSRNKKESKIAQLQIYIQRLKELAEPSTNDKRHAEYVRYYNGFLEVMGNERVYLVGSTGENSKLRWSTDGGDADFIMVSGKLAIPVENLEPREEMPVYVWVRGTNLDPQLCGRLVDGMYLSPEILRSVNPRLFTTLRAIYTIVSSTQDSIPGRQSRVTTTGVDSKVGLARTEYHNLNIVGEHFQPDLVPSLANRSAEFTAYLQRRWRGVGVNQADLKLLRRILGVAMAAKVPGMEGNHHGQVAYLASLLEVALHRPPVSDENVQVEDAPIFDNDIDMDDENEDTGVRATYSEKTSKDFVPAARVIGTLPCMLTFLERVKGSQWPAADVVAEIYKADVFVVSRKAPINSVVEKDCCLSFNLAEIKLSQNLPAVAKKVFLIMKSYLKGALKKMFKVNGRNLKLKTYHMKMTMFWACESESLEIWNETNIIQAIQTVLDFFLARLDDRCLRHYFVLSNLFVGFEDEDYFLLRECIEDIKKDPVGNIEHFFDMDKQMLAEVWLSRREAACIVSMKHDGGRGRNVDKIEDAVIDVVRGFNESPKDALGNAPIKEGIMKALDLFLEDERKKIQQTGSTSSGTRQGNEVQAIAGLMNAFVTGGGSQSHRSREATQRLDLLAGIGSLFPESRSFLSNVGGASGLQNILEATADPAADHTVELRRSVERFLSCNDADEKRLGDELKQKLVAYFMGREEK